MAGLASGLKYLSVIQKAILGSGDWQDAVLDYFEGASYQVLTDLFPEAGWIGDAPVVSFSGDPTERVLTFASGTYRFYAAGRLGVITPGVTLGCDLVPYPEGIDCYAGFCVDTYPNEVDVTTDGVKFFKRTSVGVGKTYTPSSVAVDGDGLKITLPIEVWTWAAGTRPAVAWLISPVTGSSEAFYTGTAVLDGSDVVVNVPHVFGQGVPSTTAADYSVFVAGPVVSATPLSGTLYVSASHVIPPTVGPDPAFDASVKRYTNQLGEALVRATEILSPVYSATAERRWQFRAKAEDDGVAVPNNGFQWVGRVFDYNDTPDGTSVAKRVFAFFKSGTTTGLRLYPAADSTGNLVGFDVARLAMGGNGDIGLRASLQTVGGIAGHVIDIARNDAAAVLARFATVSGSQADETETGKKAVHLVPDLRLLGANGKLVSRVLSLSGAQSARASAAGADSWWLYYTGTTAVESRWVPNAAAPGLLAFHIPAIPGRKLISVLANVQVFGVGKKITGSVSKYTAGTGVTVLSPVVTWETGDDGTKTMTLTAEETVTPETLYWVRFEVVAGEEPTEPDSGIRFVQVQERLFELQ